MDAERLRLLLPEVYQRAATPGSALSAVLDVMADLHEPVEQIIADFPAVVDPWRTPDRFVPYLARWVGLTDWLDADGEFTTGLGRLRVAIDSAAELAAHRGTVAGLRHALVLALDEPGVRVEEAATDSEGRPTPFRVRVLLPEPVAEHLGLVQRIVAAEKAAHAVVEIVIDPGPAAVAPGAGDEGAP